MGIDKQRVVTRENGQTEFHVYPNLVTVQSDTNDWSHVSMGLSRETNPGKVPDGARYSTYNDSFPGAGKFERLPFQEGYEDGIQFLALAIINLR